MPQVTTGRTSEILIESDQDLAAHVDGELIRNSTRTLKVKILPKILEVIVPDA
jgi:diacylglycerol kinase family enzyme